MQAFVGVATDLNATVIAFKGTQENRFVHFLAVYVCCAYFLFIDCLVK